MSSALQVAAPANGTTSVRPAAGWLPALTRPGGFLQRPMDTDAFTRERPEDTSEESRRRVGGHCRISMGYLD
ncbi:hypothetical protein GCM10020229_39250 [Kitasatospora albolonga]|uniref:hypothetical protein n=1 Tax=Kitasatospora albolonga TaxID=68173 RepID=UPI0031EDC6BF